MEAIGPERDSACLPLVAAGVIMGLLFVEWPANLQIKNGSQIVPDTMLMQTVSEQLALALANLRLRDKLCAQAMNDPLTGLYNRRQLDNFIVRAMADSKRSGGSFGVLMIDIDHFKRFNDEFGHDAGDLVIVTVADALSRALRECDVAFRHGGEEFVTLLGGANEDAALLCAERMLKTIRTLRLTHLGRVLPKVTVSIGIGVYPNDGAGTESLLRAADAALYRAKQEGRDRLVLCPRTALTKS